MTNWLYPDSCLAIFAKAPQPGKVKTRLLPAINAQEAARLHQRLIFRTLELTHQKALCNVQLWCSPTTDHSAFQSARSRYPISLQLQVGCDLGERMLHALTSNLNRYRSVLLIGCDCPSLDSSDLENALEALQGGADIVLGPAEDGGYVMIGGKRPVPELFAEMPWGTDQVLPETRERIRQLQLRCFETRCHWDLDRPEDLHRFMESCG